MIIYKTCKLQSTHIQPFYHITTQMLAININQLFLGKIDDDDDDDDNTKFIVPYIICKEIALMPRNKCNFSPN